MTANDIAQHLVLIGDPRTQTRITFVTERDGEALGRFEGGTDRICELDSMNSSASDTEWQFGEIDKEQGAEIISGIVWE